MPGDVAEARGNPHEIEAVANTAAKAVQHGALAQQAGCYPLRIAAVVR